MDLNSNLDSTQPQDSLAQPLSNSFANPEPVVSHMDSAPEATNVHAIHHERSPITPIESKPDQPVTTGSDPMPVVRVLSPRGVEYVFLAFALYTAAISLTVALISVLNGETNFVVLEYPTAALVISMPVFAILFLRLKRAELHDPALRNEASKRRTTQFFQIVNFAICFFTLIGVVAAIFDKMSGNLPISLTKILLDALVVIVVAGGILSYYWWDEHKAS